MPGLPKEIFSDKNIVERFICSICLLVFRDAVQSPCGHRYCDSCIKEQIKNRKGELIRCPACPENSTEGVLIFDEVCPDFVVRRELRTAVVVCFIEGCDWRGSAHQYVQEHENTCPFEKIKCLKSGCGKTVKRGDLSHHLEKECPMRLVECKQCKKQYPYKESKKHASECSNALITCSSCNKRVPRTQMESHLDVDTGDCPKLKIRCMYFPLGCTAKLDASRMEEHLAKNVMEHNRQIVNTLSNSSFLKGESKGASPMIERSEKISKVKERYFDEAALSGNLREMVVGKVEDSKGSNTSKVVNGGVDLTAFEGMLNLQMEESRREIRKLSRDIEKKVASLHNNFQEKDEKTGSMIAVLDRRTETLQQVLAVLSNELEAVHSKVSALQQQNTYLKEFTEKQEKRLQSQDQMLTLKNIALAEQELRIQALEASSYDGVLLWKINEVRRRRQEGVSGKTTSFYSPVFYTSRHGYKLSARIYLNGDGLGKHTHMSLFFVVMRGRHDALLPWPFHQKVTFMLMNQNNREHVIDAFRPDPASSSFKRPNSDMNVASGCPLFIAQEVLDSTDSFIKDDTMFVKVVVDTVGLDNI
ncbi:TNF receptor-associated factor 3-like [Asterias rubens]|uniref:TNF receptor-associated factor 3-like n=1 Tax=Asterias rubens TaxID=7604 RepID=UPI001454F5C8|nr:TNF receptor-associated factor 3-like [Asterias rubens]XP_033642804.1 TNF receptor-associated factor 3-like [Asterias rubens]XP_033642805.1 TNF receptor-associated factor 3-like [Asterias rubens]